MRISITGVHHRNYRETLSSNILRRITIPPQQHLPRNSYKTTDLPADETDTSRTSETMNKMNEDKTKDQSVQANENVRIATAIESKDEIPEIPHLQGSCHPTNSPTDTKPSDLNNELKDKETKRQSASDKTTTSRPPPGSRNTSRPTSASKTTKEINGQADDEVFSGTQTPPDRQSRPLSGIDKTSRPTSANKTTKQIDDDIMTKEAKGPIVVNNENVSRPTSKSEESPRPSNKETKRQSSSDKTTTSRPPSGSRNGSRPTSASKTTKEINGQADDEVLTGTQTPPDRQSRPSSGIDKTSKPTSANKTTKQIDNDIMTSEAEGPIVVNNENVSRPTSKSEDSPRPSSTNDKTADVLPADETDISKASETMNKMNKDKIKDQSDPANEKVTETTLPSIGSHSRPLQEQKHLDSYLQSKPKMRYLEIPHLQGNCHLSIMYQVQQLKPIQYPGQNSPTDTKLSDLNNELEDKETKRQSSSDKITTSRPPQGQETHQDQQVSKTTKEINGQADDEVFSGTQTPPDRQSRPLEVKSPVNNVSSSTAEANTISRTNSPTDTKPSDLNNELEDKEIKRQSSSDKINTSRPPQGQENASRPTSASTQTPPDRQSRPSSEIDKTSRPTCANKATKQIDDDIMTSEAEGPIVVNNENVSRPTSKSEDSPKTFEYQ
ncbi:unnamed protein product [Mytilus edulis]|uniref:Uncharacterized protein n=1 Tax=Mytilus edulis TaxID=6550 RepID=A0A8S3RSZ2_MYTED|nr:unnamed protein product [Mytilus edulis]